MSWMIQLMMSLIVRWSLLWLYTTDKYSTNCKSFDRGVKYFVYFVLSYLLVFSSSVFSCYHTSFFLFDGCVDRMVILLWMFKFGNFKAWLTNMRSSATFWTFWFLHYNLDIVWALTKGDFQSRLWHIYSSFGWFGVCQICT